MAQQHQGSINKKLFDISVCPKRWFLAEYSEYNNAKSENKALNHS
jgi:uncharacterized protein (DUF2225 family)